MTDEEFQAAEQAAARDPSTSTERLAELVEFFPEEVLANPALALLVLAEPDFWSQFSYEALAGLASSPSCPLSLVQWALQGAALCCGVLWRNEALPRELRREVLLRMRGESGWSVVLQDWDQERPLLAQVLTDDELSLLERAPDETLTEAEVERLARVGAGGRLRAGLQPHATAALLERLAPTAEADGSMSFLMHPKANPARLTAAFQATTSADGWWWAAQNPALTEAQFALAMQHPELHEYLAQNPSLPPECMPALARSDQNAKWRLAVHPSLSAEAQLVLAGDTDPSVRATLREHPNLTPETRRRLARSDAKWS